jgi:glycosyltransferase involved in cell wall biosynthesis
VVIDPNKFVIVGQGIFPEKIQGGDGSRFRKKYGIQNDIVFQVGSKNVEKGSYNLIEAMKNNWNNGLDCTLVFAGGHNKDFSNYIESLEKRYKEKILNIDNISDEDKLDLYDAGDVFSMISKTDSFGIVYLEAWLYKNPVLGCKSRVIEEVIEDGRDGFLLEFDDIDKIADQISFLLRDKELKNRVGEMGYNKVLSKYNWNKRLKILDDVYNI